MLLPSISGLQQLDAGLVRLLLGHDGSLPLHAACQNHICGQGLGPPRISGPWCKEHCVHVCRGPFLMRKVRDWIWGWILYWHGVILNEPGHSESRGWKWGWIVSVFADDKMAERSQTPMRRWKLYDNCCVALHFSYSKQEATKYQRNGLHIQSVYLLTTEFDCLGDPVLLTGC